MSVVRCFCLSTAFVCAAAHAATQTDILLYRQAPDRGFGFESDTLATNDFGQPTAELVADTFSLAQPACIARVVGFGFYGGGDSILDPLPPVTETIRVRFYSDVAGLPGELLSEAIFLDSPREWTGATVGVSPRRKEYRYQFDLPLCFPADTETPYWIEIAQIGDADSLWRWESANGGEFAVRFPIDTPYRIVHGLGQLAYELRTPELSSLNSVGLAVMVLLARRSI